ncbi:MAG TPA: hypothetical protein PLM71_04665 [Syntrophorhabdaceae bacterium]|nr:hypothetical protein [Syntrophorhabdaceae bacterium]
MKVDTSVIKLSSNYNASYREKNTRITITRPVMQDTVDVSQLAMVNLKASDTKQASEIEKDYMTEKQRIARFLIELIFGVKLNKIIVNKTQEETAKNQNNNSSQQYEIINIDFEEKFEKEDVDFTAEGMVKTSDGRLYNFNLSIKLNRSLYESNVSINRQLQGKDPIVLNLSGIFKGLSEKTIDFDIDGDGITEKIHFVSEGSGFLVIDKNNNGKIDDGKEVIGATSGNGIKELKDYDSDGNGWIDEGDPIFLNLSVWEEDPLGNSIITPLKEKGIGAISLASAVTPFQIKNTKGNYGEILETGVFLNEDGKASAFHRINLFV